MKRKRKQSSTDFTTPHLQASSGAGSLPDINEKVADVTVNGSEGEGGGQIIRIALPLAMLLSRSVRITDVRKGRPNPGLRPQHLASAQMVAQITSACLFGGQISSGCLFLEPGEPKEISLPLTTTVGTAGAISLVLQAVLPVALKFLPGYSIDGDQISMRISGGTSVPWSPTSDYIKYVFVPNLRLFGLRLRYDVIRHGFFPQGGGECAITIDKSNCANSTTEDGGSGKVMQSCALTRRGNVTCIKGSLIVSGKEYPQHGVVDAMIQRTVQVVRKFTRSREGYPEFGYTDIEVQELSGLDARDDSMVLTLYAHASCGTVLGSSVIWNARMAARNRDRSKQKQSRKENVRELKFARWRDCAASSGESAATELCEALESLAVVDMHMADQLCILMAMSEGISTLLVPEPSRHLLTVVQLLKQFGINTHLAKVPNSNYWELTCEGRNMLLQDQK
ncbi:RNA 3'-terminal phosphate cyclase [Gracilaria domingensis]|nr:RNA 3'-terminal phosphate cyclase [Gracilaria domingensis]